MGEDDVTSTILCFYLADRCRDCLTFCQWCLQKNLIIQKTSSRWSLISSISHCVFHNASEKFSNGYKATDQKNMRFKYMNWLWQIYFDYLVTCCQIYFKKVLTHCGCMRVYIKTMHMLVTAWTSDKYFFLEVSILSVCLPVCLKPLWALVSIGIWWIESLCHWISTGTWTCQTVWCIKNCGHKLSDEWNDFQWNEILSVEFYSKRIDKCIVMS